MAGYTDRGISPQVALLGGSFLGVSFALLLWWVMPGDVRPMPKVKVAVEEPGPIDTSQTLADEDKALMRGMLLERPDVGEVDFDRQVWIADLVNVIGERLHDASEAQEIARFVHRYARHFKLSPELVLSVMAVESNFDRFAISRAGARGLMQVMPFWKEDIGMSEDNLFDIETNIRYGCAILRFYLDRHEKTAAALAAYNGSLGDTRYPLLVFEQMRRFKTSREDLQI